MKVNKLVKRASACFAFFFLVMSLPFAQAMFGEDQIDWARMEGAIVPGTTTVGPNDVAGITSPGFSWTARRGYARVRLDRDHIRFLVEGLVLASQTNDGTDVVIGVPSPVVTDVKGTLVCDADDAGAATTFDTPTVPLDAQGDARFSGTALVALPATCDNAAFLIIIVGDEGDGLWIASGMERTP